MKLGIVAFFMLRAIVFLLYCLAVLTGVGGLFAGGIPMAEYAWARWHNPSVDYVLNFDFISKSLHIFMLSIILLILVHVSYVICHRFRRNPKKLLSSGRQQPDSSLASKPISQLAETQKEQPVEQTPDEKLARLLIDVKKE